MPALSAFAKACSLGCKYVGLLFFYLYGSATAEPLEQRIAAKFLTAYQENEQRLAAIDQRLKKLPFPYTREPTGTGGFVSTQKEHADDIVVLTFHWDEAHEIHAAALFPLRLFMDEIYAENLYWPGHITIETDVGTSTLSLAQIKSSESGLHQSLPEFVQFDSVKTNNLTIRCTGLQQHPQQKWYAAGLAEVFIFSDKKNIAPLAVIQTNGSREGINVLWSKFLTDDQTPLGIPQTSAHTENSPNFFRVTLGNKKLEEHPLTLTLHYTEPVEIDAVRLDPSSRSFHGQGFPRHFSIELLDSSGSVQQSYKQYVQAPLRNPGLNPLIARFETTKASSVRITILEEPDVFNPSGRIIGFSEIIPMYRGSTSGTVNKIEMRFGDALTEHTLNQSKRKRGLATLIDGTTQDGRVIHQYEWAEGLHERQRLMEKQLGLQRAQQSTLTRIHRALLIGSILLIVMVTSGAVLAIVRIQIHARREIRITRAQIASDLHDDVGSNLGTVIIRAEQLQKEDTPDEHGRLQQILQLTQESVLGLQEVLQATAPEIGHHKSLSTHLQELTTLMLGQTPFSIEIDPGVNELLTSNLTRGRFILFYKEAIHNAKKHAQCTHVDISLKQATRALILCIGDNGVGIDAARLSKARTLRTLKKRAEWLGGKLSIDSAPKQGTRLTLELPIASLRHAHYPK